MPVSPDGGQRPAPPAPFPLLTGLVIAVAAVVLVTHWPALSAQALSFDDNQYLTENPLVQRPSWPAAGRFLTEVLEPSTVRGYYQPLTMISLMIDHALGGRPDELAPFHRTSLALHVLNTALVIVLLYLLFGQPWVAAMVGLLYGVHPLTVEPIPWVGERKTLLTTFFALWCLVLYVRYTRRNGWRPYAGSMIAYVLALMSKPTSTPLPVLLLLLDYWPGRRLGRRAILEKIPFFVIAGISAIVTYVSQARTAAVATPSEYSPTVVPLTLCHNVVFYLYKIVWPVNLSPHYPYPSPFDLTQPMVVAGVIGTCLLIPVLLLSWRWTRALLVGWLFFFVALFPTSGVIGFTHSIASDKYAYLPSIGLLLPLAWLVGWAWEVPARGGSARPRRLGMVAIVLMLAGVAVVASRRQLAHWQGTEAHFRYMLTLAPDARVLHSGLADALRSKALALMQASGGPTQRSEAVITEAIQHYRQALRTGRDSPFGRNDLLTCSARNNLGNLLAQRGQLDEAIAHWQDVLRMNPKQYNALNNLGIGLARKGKVDEAIRCYTAALRIRPDLPETHNNLGVQLGRKGQIDQAIGHYVEALRLKPGFEMAFKNLRAALGAKGMSDQEIRRFLRSHGIQAPGPGR